MKIAQFTDIHWGARNNSLQHLDDCDEFIDWFIQKVKETKCDAIAFLGDWFENRSAISVETLYRSQQAARKLNDVGIPIFFIIGNHDLYLRSDRRINSTNHFMEFGNFKMVSSMRAIVDDLGNSILFCPFLFKEEYAQYAGFINEHRYVFGHFEFKDFVVTGKNKKMEHGPDIAMFNTPKYIFSGHYHKRQWTDNVIYIGNTFCTNFGDVDDVRRGMCILDTRNDNVSFVDYPKCPRFYKVKLSSLMDGELSFHTQSRVHCVVDIEVPYSEIQALKTDLVSGFNLREFTLEDAFTSSQMANQIDDSDVDEGVSLANISETVEHILVNKLTIVNSDIDPERLVALYNKARCLTV